MSEEIHRRESENLKRVFSKKKLHLVLDLDHTLLHAKKIEKPTKDEKLLIDGESDTFIFNHEYLIKFRPFVREFLEGASCFFLISLDV